MSALGKKKLYIGALLVLLSGCVSKDMNDLEQLVAEPVRPDPSKIKPLPKITAYESYVYSADGMRDPFVPLFEEPKETAVTAIADARQKAFLREINERNREELESFELDSLRMVGTLTDVEDLWGVIKDPTGTVHRVQVGNYMGRNYGKITGIFDDRIDLREIFQDLNGQWDERIASVALFED